MSGPVEVPEAAVEAAARVAYERTKPGRVWSEADALTQGTHRTVARWQLTAAYPLLAARVREQIIAGAPNQVKPSDVVIVGARMTEDVLALVRGVEAAFAARVRAERGAEIAGLIRKNAATLDSFAREGSTAGLIAYLIDNVMAAPEDMGGAVLIEPGRPDQDGRDREPDWRAIAGQAVEALRLTREYVEPTVRLPAYPGWSWFDATNRYLTATGQPTVPPEPADPRPHSRACGPREHPHGPQCAADCRTCSAEGAR